MFNYLKNAFAVNPPSSPPTAEQLKIVDRLAHEVVRRHLSVPALTFLEMSRPLNFLGAQAMHFFSPMVSALFNAPEYEILAQFLERRDAMDLISERIEQLEKIAEQHEDRAAQQKSEER